MRERHGAGGAGGDVRPDLARELRELGRAYDRAEPERAADAEDMAARVLADLLADDAHGAHRAGAPGRAPARAGWPGRLSHRLRARWRAACAALCGLLAVAVLTPPVRAAVSDWFDFGGVTVQHAPSAPAAPSEPVPGCGAALPLRTAAERARFTPLVPEALGSPDGVQVAKAPRGSFRISLCWVTDEGTIRLDQFPSSLNTGFLKTVTDQPEALRLRRADGSTGQEPALWFRAPHRLTFWLGDGSEDQWVRAERIAGPTLLWSTDGTTLRLEGVASRARALRIAESVQ
ncbi:hypothetical protein ACFWIA_00265 [Streptomyces sp. NPDC127068]|uniref:hypothetical protein n=1 Tax=Streptomyces sp. NPDC127068 TaxID=3347127 RepID=UPI0036671377